ncbi:MAG: hypothetical protein EZS28_047986 [Streblomastix strix]|uniref:Uncharacterized protein n=1 Tax=Streblomastix strix TaxID=222440 RepID=A0A5J4TE94_9EUKA|nr:MAG: hypothetical protein EZS28_047986 [Streblomastix strix]
MVPLEYVEYEGGLEEIESLLVNREISKNQTAIKTKREILNSFHYQEKRPIPPNKDDQLDDPDDFNDGDFS